MKEKEIEQREATQFLTRAQAHVFVIQQEKSSFLCEPEVTFFVEQAPGGQLCVCKCVDYSEIEGTGRKEEKSIQRYPVDGCTLCPSEIDMRLYLNQFRPLQERFLTLATDMGVNSSVWLLGRHSNQLNNNFLFSEEGNDDLFRSAITDLFARMYTPTAHMNEFMRLSWSVHIKCFEIFGDQVVDLFLPKKTYRNSDRSKGQRRVENTTPQLYLPKVREDPQLGTVVTGLTRRNFKTSDTAYEALQLAFRRRHILIAESAVSGSRNLFGQRVIGTVGCVFVQVEIEQMFYPMSLASRETFDAASSFQYTSNIQFNILADIDALSFKPSKQDAINVVCLDDFLLYGLTDVKENTKHKTASTNLSVLASAHKSLSTLSRVLRTLAGQDNSSRLSQDEISQSQDLEAFSCPSIPTFASSSSFVPYRDSTLTRVLQPSLEGNYVNSIYLCLSKDSNASISNALRMTMELRGLLQHVERRKSLIFRKNEDKSQLSSTPKTPTKTPAKPSPARVTLQRSGKSFAKLNREGSGVFVGQEKRKEVGKLPVIKNDVEKGVNDSSPRVKVKNSLDEDRDAGVNSDEEEVFSEENVEKSFWNILSHYREDKNMFSNSKQYLEDLEFQRRLMLEQLDMEIKVEDDIVPSNNEQLSFNPSPIRVDVTSNLHNNSTQDIFSSVIDEEIHSPDSAKIKSGRGSILQHSVSMPDSKDTPPAERPHTVCGGSDSHYPRPMLHSLSAGADKSAMLSKNCEDKYEEISDILRRPIDTPLDISLPGYISRPPSRFLKPSIAHHESTGLDELISNEDNDVFSIPQPVESHKVVIEHRPKQSLHPLSCDEPSSPVPHDVVVHSPFNGSFPPTKKGIEDISKKTSIYDSVDFVQLSISTSNMHFNNPSGFIDICEQQGMVMPTHKPHHDSNDSMKIHEVMPRTNVTGKNIWGSSVNNIRSPVEVRLPKKSDTERGMSDIKRTLFSDLDKKSNFEVTVPDLGLSSTEIKEVTKSSGVVLTSKTAQPLSSVSFPLLTGTDVEKQSVQPPSPIRVSIKNKQTSRFKNDSPILNETDDVESSGLSGLELAFMRAVSHSNLSEVRKHVSSGVNIHLKNSFERDALQVATRNGDLDIMKCLIESGASTATRGRYGDTLFHIAAGSGHVDVLRWLHEQRIMHNLLDMYGQSAAHVAARRGEVEVLRFLGEELHMKLNEEDFEGLTPYQRIPKRSLHGNDEGVTACRKYLLSVIEKE